MLYFMKMAVSGKSLCKSVEVLEVVSLGALENVTGQVGPTGNGEVVTDDNPLTIMWVIWTKSMWVSTADPQKTWNGLVCKEM